MSSRIDAAPIVNTPASKLTYENVTMRFGDVTALDHVSLSLKPGHIYGLLGRNGAGKSTLLSLTAGWRHATEGDVLLDGKSVWENANALQQIVCMSDGNLFPTLRVKQGLLWYSRCRPGFDLEQAMRLCEKFELSLKAKIHTLSTGYGTIFKLIVAMASQAPFTFYDEPVLGLDANHRDLFYRELMEDFGNNPRCVVISTHLIEECASLLDHIIVINKGKLMLNEPVEETLARGYAVSGPAGVVDAFTAGKKLFGTQSLGGLKTAYVQGSPGQEHPPEGIEIGKLDLQQLFIQLTND